MKWLSLLTASLLFTLPLLSSAEIYEHVDANGNITLSDSPMANSKSIKAPATSSYKSAPAPKIDLMTQAKDSAVENKDDNAYTQFNFRLPRRDGTTFTNRPTIPIIVNVKPKLAEGDTVELYLNGKLFEKKPGTNFQFGLLERGTYTIKADLKNADGELLERTPTWTIYVKRRSSITAPNAARQPINLNTPTTNLVTPATLLTRPGQ